jgi:rRNA maturation endonuclease Nob1/ketosteroid isomerase-like protein
MLVCLSCNIEFKEDKKFCSYCGGSLVTKEDLAPNKKSPEKEEEKSEQKLICPNCKTVYEFGSSCIQCGCDLVTEIPPEGKEVSEADHKGPEDKKERLQPEEPREKQIGKPREDLICPTCKISYKNGNFCPKCGSPLLPQMLAQASEEAEETFKPKTGEELVPLQTIQEYLIETPRKNLICPQCKIIYERGSSCVRCGSALVVEVTAQDAGTTEPPGSPEDAFDQSTPRKTSLTGPVEAPEPKNPNSSPSIPKRQPDVGPAHDGVQHRPERIEREELELFSDIETDKLFGAPKQDSAVRSADNLERRSVNPKKRKIDYRRLFLEVGSISIMVLAGGYLLWSVYSHVTKLPEPKVSRPKEVSAPAHSNPPNPLNATAKVPVPQESEKEEEGQRSVIPTEKTEAVPSSSSIPSDPTVVEALEIGKIKDLLQQIRQANLQKDIDLFLSCYASDFKDRDGKKKATLSFWKKFDYLELSYDLKRTSITGDTARVKIEWVIKISSKAGGNLQESKTFFDAVLKKEEGSWKIQEVKQAG